MEWIPLNEKKPIINQIVFALINSKVPVIVKYSKEYFTDDGLEVENITHWVSIPDIPNKKNSVFPSQVLNLKYLHIMSQYFKFF